MATHEHDVAVDGVTLRVRETGPADGTPVMHFHGTPGSRLELAWAEDVVAAAGVRMIAFDRPGYGGSTTARFSLASVARMAVQVADEMDLPAFRTTGWSGGGPFALATAATAPERVEAVGVIASPCPFQLVPETLQDLSDDDKEALSLLPDDPEGAAARFAAGFDMTESLKSPDALAAMFEPMMCEWDRTQSKAPGRTQAFHANLLEAMNQGPWGGAWDNVAWVGDWEADPTTVRCPVLLWYGSEDRFASPVHGRWFEANLPTSRLVIWQGEGHLLPYAHLAQMLRELVAISSG